MRHLLTRFPKNPLTPFPRSSVVKPLSPHPPFTRCVRAALVVAALIAAGAPALAQSDLSGHWVKPNHEEHLGDARIGDYTGLPINEAARVKADTWNSERWGMPEHQCEPHPSTYAPIGPSNMRIWPEVDPLTQEIVAWHMVLHWMEMHRTIWMDGREHPPEWAPHTWMGFSTGTWDGDQLVVETTHIKAGWIRRNGLPHSDKAVMREHFVRTGNLLTLISVVNDPVYLTEPLIRSYSWEAAPGYQVGSYPCDISVEVEHPEGHVPFNLPGQNRFLNEAAELYKLPLEAVRGGAETTRPEYAETLRRMIAAKPPATPSAPARRPR